MRIAVWLLCIVLPEIACAKIMLVLRYDDLSASSNCAFEKRLFAELEKRHRSVLVGIIPGGGIQPRSCPDKWSVVARYAGSGTVELALHGYSHQPNDRYPGPGKSEFACLPFFEQDRLIALGKRYLEAVLFESIGVFIPPFNSYDENTLKALLGNGISLLSSGLSGAVAEKMRFLPGTTYPQDMRRVVNSALVAGVDGIVVVVMHPYDFLESGAMLPESRKNHGAKQLELDSFLAQLDSLPKQVEQVSVALLQARDDLSADRFLVNQKLRARLLIRRGLLPDWSRVYPVDGIYYKRVDAVKLYWYQNFIAFLIYFGILIFASALGRMIAVLGSRFLAIGFVAILMSLLIALGYKFFKDGPYIRSALLFTVCFGAILGYSIGMLKSVKDNRF